MEPSALNGSLNQAVKNWPAPETFEAAVAGWKQAWKDAEDIWQRETGDKTALKSPREIRAELASHEKK